MFGSGTMGVHLRSLSAGHRGADLPAAGRRRPAGERLPQVALWI